MVFEAHLLPPQSSGYASGHFYIGCWVREISGVLFTLGKTACVGSSPSPRSSPLYARLLLGCGALQSLLCI